MTNDKRVLAIAARVFVNVAEFPVGFRSAINDLETGEALRFYPGATVRDLKAAGEMLAKIANGGDLPCALGHEIVRVAEADARSLAGLAIDALGIVGGAKY